MTVEVLLALNLAVMLGYVAYQVSASVSAKKERERQEFEEIADILGLSPVDLRLVTQVSPVHSLGEPGNDTYSHAALKADRRAAWRIRLHRAGKGTGFSPESAQPLAEITPIFGRIRQTQERRSRLSHPAGTLRHRLESQDTGA